MLSPGAFRSVCFWGFLLALLVLTFAAFCANGRFLGIDDAHIFFDYAENLCRGNGITYSNNGIRVEGCTSMLWLLVCTINFYLGLNEAGVFACCVILLLAAQKIWVGVLDALTEGRDSSAVYRLSYCVMILSSYGYVAWMTVTCMDLALWGFLLAWMTNVFLRAVTQKGCSIFDAVPFALAPLCRPEAMFLCPSCLALVLASSLLHGKSASKAVLPGLAFLVSLSVLTIFRLSYFGYPFPNTYYAKVSPSLLYNLQTGFVYAARYMLAGVAPCLVCICFLAKGVRLLPVLFSPSRWNAISPQDFLWLWGVSLFLPPILTGGDHFLLFRFYQAQYPLFCILVAVAMLPLLKLERSPARRLLFGAGLAAFAAFAWRHALSWEGAFGDNTALGKEFGIARNGMEGGRAFTSLFNDLATKPTIGVVSAGGFARTYSGKVTDLLGLNDLTIAHAPGERKGMKNHAAFEVGLFGLLDVDIMPFAPDEFMQQILKGLFTNETFIASWRYGTLRKGDASGEAQQVLISRRALEPLLKTASFEFTDDMVWNGNEWRIVSGCGGKVK